MQRNLESRLQALEKVHGKDCTDVVIRRLSIAGESFGDFKRRAFSELEIPANAMRVLISEGKPMSNLESRLATLKKHAPGPTGSM